MNLPNPEQVNRVHEDLKAFLLREHPRADLLAIVVALSYEIGRCAAMMTEGMSDAETRRMLDGIADVMFEHVHAFRRGMKE
jgi:hypothetical protein